MKILTYLVPIEKKNRGSKTYNNLTKKECQQFSLIMKK